MTSYCALYFSAVYHLLLKILGSISEFLYGSKSCGNRSQRGEKVVPNKITEDSVFLQTSKRQFIPCENLSKHFEEAKDLNFSVREMYVGSEESEEVLLVSDHRFDEEIPRRKEDSIDQKLEKGLLESEKGLLESEEGWQSFSFRFNRYTINEDINREGGKSPSLCREEVVYEEKDEILDRQNKVVCEEKDEILDNQILLSEVEFPPTEVASEEKDEISDNQDVLSEVESPPCREGVAYEESDEISDDQDFSYEVEFPPYSGFSTVDSSEEFDSSDHDEPLSDKFEDSDDDYIELKPSPMNTTPRVISRDSTDSWDSDFSDDDDDDEVDEDDVLWEHQKLVQQMKTELKSSRAGGLPTISEEYESPKINEEDLKPLEINRKIEYKDVIHEIQKLYKSYLERMRKLDILNYQTLQAISFLQLKDSEVFTVGKNAKNRVAFILPRVHSSKGQRIHADQSSHKSVKDMHRDLELVYVGQLCLSWEILRWLHVKARELLRQGPKGYLYHSYNRAAEDFQQFQVVLQRFMEDERFQGDRNRSYVRSRCMIRRLLQVPTIKDDSVKERRDETDAISLEKLAEIIEESIMIFKEFLFSDKNIHGARTDHQDPQNSELLADIISTLQKKERQIREQVRCQNCIVKKLRKHQELRSGGVELSTSQAETRLVSRVLCVPRLTRDQLVWCQSKLNNISFVGRKVHVEPSFLLFPC